MDTCPVRPLDNSVIIGLFIKLRLFTNCSLRTIGLARKFASVVKTEFLYTILRLIFIEFVPFIRFSLLTISLCVSLFSKLTIPT